MARQDNQEFFQALQNPRPTPTEPSRGAQPAPPAKEASLLGPSLAIGGENAAFRPDSHVVALVLGVVIAVVLLAAAWVWGYYAGRAGASRGSVAETPREDPAGPAAGGTTSTPGAETPKPKPRPGTPKINTFYSLCIVTYDSEPRAEEMRGKITTRGGIEAFVVRIGEKFSVAVGRLTDPNGAEARRLRERFSKMDFEGQTRPFQKAYYVKVKMREE